MQNGDYTNFGDVTIAPSVQTVKTKKKSAATDADRQKKKRRHHRSTTADKNNTLEGL